MNAEQSLPAGRPSLSPSAKREKEEDDWSLPKRESEKKNLTVCSVHAGIQSSSSFCRPSVRPSSPVRLSRASVASFQLFL